MIDAEQLAYWEEVIQGQRFADPPDGIDLADLAQWVIDLLREALQMCEEARERARDYLPCVKYQYDDPNAGRAFEREQRASYPWLGPSETPLDDIPDTYEDPVQ